MAHLLLLCHVMNVKKNRQCPLLANPLPECYCLRSQSIWITKIVEFCGGRFESCEYYRIQKDNVAMPYHGQPHEEPHDQMNDMKDNNCINIKLEDQ